jgi:hypothetical protein
LLKFTLKVVGLRLAVVSLITFMACSPRHAVSTNSSLDQAIALYIEGNYEQARDRIADLVGQLETDHDLRTAYLYLGRCCMALEDYAGAGDALLAGRMFGEEEIFNEYLYEIRSRLRAAEANIGTAESVTRAQLACLLRSMFLSSAGVETVPPLEGDAEGSSRMAPDVATHWAEDCIWHASAAGFMGTLPDGRFHPEVRITRMAFFFIVQRIAAAIGAKADLLDDLYPRGIHDAIDPSMDGLDGDLDAELISGGEALSAMLRLLDSMKS